MAKNNLGFSLKKAEIFNRRRIIRKKGLSSPDVVHKITKLVDPDLSKTIEIQEAAIDNKK